MSDFTIKNLKEVEASSSAPPGLEARVARSYLDSEHLGVSYFRYEPGVRTPFGHSHGEQEEAYVVVAGSGRARLDGEIVELRQWDVLRIGEAGAYHAACEGQASWFEVACATLELSGVRGVQVTPCTTSEFPRPAVRPRYSVLDCSRLTKLRGKTLMPWRKALEAYLKSPAT